VNPPPAAPPAKWLRPLIPRHAAVGDAFAALCNAALAQIAANAPGVARGDDPEYLHQLRVGMRRLLSALRAFRPLLRRKRADAVARPLRKMMRLLGAARDWDVFLETLAQAKLSNALALRAAHERAAAQRATRELVNSRAFRDARSRTLSWLEAEPWRAGDAPAQPLVSFARRSLERTHAKLLKRARRIDWRDVERRHAVRIALKRLRYGCDFFAPCFSPRAVPPYLARLAALQDTLGQLNDIAVARVLLDELAAENELSVRRRLARRERELIASAAKDWTALARKRPYWQTKRAPLARR
jgi:triphosphatase